MQLALMMQHYSTCRNSIFQAWGTKGLQKWKGKQIERITSKMKVKREISTADVSFGNLFIFLMHCFWEMSDLQGHKTRLTSLLSYMSRNFKLMSLSTSSYKKSSRQISFEFTQIIATKRMYVCKKGRNHMHTFSHQSIIYWTCLRCFFYILFHCCKKWWRRLHSPKKRAVNKFI